MAKNAIVYNLLKTVTVIWIHYVEDVETYSTTTSTRLQTTTRTTTQTMSSTDKSDNKYDDDDDNGIGVSTVLVPLASVIMMILFIAVFLRMRRRHRMPPQTQTPRQIYSLVLEGTMLSSSLNTSIREYEHRHNQQIDELPPPEVLNPSNLPSPKVYVEPVSPPAYEEVVKYDNNGDDPPPYSFSVNNS